MHRKPATLVDRIPYTLLTLVSLVTLAYAAYLAHHALTSVLTVEWHGITRFVGWLWSEVHPHAEFGRTGWLAIGDRNPLIDWDLHWSGSNIGAWGHRVGYGWYGTLIFPHHSPNGGAYVELFGHSYGWEFWGHFGPFMDTD